MDNLQWTLGRVKGKSGFQPIGVPKFFVEINRMEQRMGSEIDLPDDILDSKLVLSMSNVKDNMCFFHCVTKELNKEIRKDRMNKKAKEYLRLMTGDSKRMPKGFKGVTLYEINDFQEKIETNINIYNMETQ